MKKALVSFAMCIILCGCYKPADINSLAYLLAVGVDSNGEQYEYTLQFANPLAFAGKESGGEGEAVKSVVVQADTLSEAFSIASARVIKEIDTSYLKLILFNKNIVIKDTIATMQKVSRFHRFRLDG